MTVIRNSSNSNSFSIIADTNNTLDFQSANGNSLITITVNDTLFNANAAMILNTGNIANAEVGMFRFNTSASSFEVYNGNNWVSFTVS